MAMEFQTERLRIRPWKESDAEDFYQYASDNRVASMAGWPAPSSVEKCRWAIREILSCWGFFALELQESHQVIGCISLLIGEASNYEISQEEGELTFWLGFPYWGQGLMQEAIQCMITYGFEDLQLTRLWCGHAQENLQSASLQKKCGFQYHHTLEQVQNMVGEPHREIVMYLDAD